MNKIKTYKQFINEEFKEYSNPNEKLTAFLNGKKKTVKDWFENGLFNSATLISIEVSEDSLNLVKDLIFEFNDQQNYYQVIFSVSMKEYKEGNFEKGGLKIKKYSMDVDSAMNSLKGLLLDEWDSNNPDNGMDNGQIDIKSDFKPEFILDVISKMEDSEQAFGVDRDVEETTQTQDQIDF